ncbi:hypothetical protein [Actinoplanes regularis]|uniref:Uncharacterized protein n=1 Tax=Actinoplanes regularis TaxID=52697 RepID=A0A238XFH8_9ACTN|nr:hypothetical protein [Actinoplanes regularis]GIE86735.1 hypothetical protein Are01nite_32150 [Actinoplanes regularis]SNR57311.1 hypothetical protein SAMN06264365_103364 [Actinoplanes regularis]
MIRAQVTDRDALAARSPSELAMYLRANGWATRGRAGSSVQWVKSIGDEEFEALQPRESTIRDYPLRVRDLLAMLAAAEERSELAILSDITSVSMDVHEVRAFPVDTGPGTIGLDDGVQAYESLRNLVLAAACAAATDQPRAVQPTRKPADVLSFLREVRIGAPAEGSFVLSVHTPVPPRLSSAQASFFDEDVADALEPAEPFERRVSLKLFDAVRAAHSAANDALVAAEGLDVFTDAVPLGVSANLCEALVGLGGEAGHPFDFSLRLAPARPLRARSFPPIRFRRDHLPLLASAAQELRERVADEGVLLVGNVVRLHREGSGPGEISIAGTIEGDDRLRRVWMSLGEEDYFRATEAHRGMLLVSVRGDLVRRGTRHHLINPSAFQPVRDPAS